MIAPDASRLSRSTVGRATTIWMLVLACGGSVHAQHYLYNSRQPAGEISRAQVFQRPHLQGYVQPVTVNGPSGCMISVASGGGFSSSEPDSMLVGLQLGYAYRFKITELPNRAAEAVYPTVELLDRLHPPRGKETRFPVPIDVTAEEIEMALSGKYVTRVIYVEDPHAALGVRNLPDQRYFEVLPDEDPLNLAGEMGRPIAILRMGSLTPGNEAPTAKFLFQSPPIQQYAARPAMPAYRPSSSGDALQPQAPKLERQTPKAPDAIDVLPEPVAPGELVPAVDPTPNPTPPDPAAEVDPDPFGDEAESPADDAFDDVLDGSLDDTVEPPIDADDPFGDV